MMRKWEFIREQKWNCVCVCVYLKSLGSISFNILFNQSLKVPCYSYCYGLTDSSGQNFFDYYTQGSVPPMGKSDR